uniref:RING-type domain-containing protein n=1 Tax=Emiliania huxleyi TaxID=2903 RepID=A0A7S3WG97_EMIHU
MAPAGASAGALSGAPAIGEPVRLVLGMGLAEADYHASSQALALYGEDDALARPASLTRPTRLRGPSDDRRLLGPHEVWLLLLEAAALMRRRAGGAAPPAEATAEDARKLTRLAAALAASVGWFVQGNSGVRWVAAARLFRAELGFSDIRPTAAAGSLRWLESPPRPHPPSHPSQPPHSLPGLSPPQVHLAPPHTPPPRLPPPPPPPAAAAATEVDSEMEPVGREDWPIADAAAAAEPEAAEVEAAEEPASRGPLSNGGALVALEEARAAGRPQPHQPPPPRLAMMPPPQQPPPPPPDVSAAAAPAAPAKEEEDEEENGEVVVAAAVVEEEAAAADGAERSREVEELRTELAAAYQELGQWRLGKLKFVPDMIDVDGDSVMTAVVADRKPQAAGRKRPLEPSPAALTGLSQQHLLIRVKQEKAEVEKEKGEISRERNALDDQLTCVVCYTERREVLFNCSHLVCCAGCARKEVHCPSTGCNTLILWRHPVDLAEHAQNFGMAVGAA